MYRRIVVGTDGSETAGAAVDQAVSLARLTSAEVVIVSCCRQPATSAAAVDPGAGMLADWLVGAEAAMRQVAEDAAAQARGKGVTASTHVATGSPAQVICRVAEKVEADLIVVGDRGMQGVGRLLTGSVPNHIAHHAPCSVLIVDTTRRVKG